MRIAIGCDHGGIVLKPAVLEYLKTKGLRPSSDAKSIQQIFDELGNRFN